MFFTVYGTKITNRIITNGLACKLVLVFWSYFYTPYTVGKIENVRC